MKSCEMSLVKYLLFLFNLLFAASGLGIIVAGGLVLADVADVNHFMANELLGPAIVLIVVGVIVFIVAFLGCFGAIRESYNILIALAICLLIIFIIELAMGVLAAVYENDFGDALKSTLKKSMANYTESKLEQVAWDKVQKNLMCCGVDGPGDWQISVPFSCCHSHDELHESFSQYCIDQAHGKYLYQSGCYGRLKMKVSDNAKVIIGVGIGIAFVEIIGIVLACWLAHSIKKQEAEK